MIRPTLFALAGLVAVPVFAAETQTIYIKTLQAQMRYDQSEISVPVGAKVKLVFENTDDLPHNLVFFKEGTDVVAVSNKQMEKPEEALKRNWLPDEPRIWLHTKLLNPKEKEELEFTAPDKGGSYPFVCTFPGHALTMQGRLNVQAEGTKLTGLRFALYLGSWEQLPDFKALKPHREGEIASNLVEIKLDDYKNQFGVVYEGKINAAKEGEYSFYVASDDGSRVLIDGKKVVEHDKIHPSSDIKEGKVKLKAGEHQFRLEYFQAAGNADLYAGWKGPGFGITPLSKWVHPKSAGGAGAKKPQDTTGMPLVVGTEPVIYRNFIAGAGNRGIGVGYPGGMNITWSAETMNLALVWRGAFMDAARHWINRGGGHQPPLGFDVVSPSGETALPVAVLASTQAAWPQLPAGQRSADFQWKGYRLDARRFPTFGYEWSGVKVSDGFGVEGDAIKGGGKLVRTVRMEGRLPENGYFRVAGGKQLRQVEGGFEIEKGVRVAVEGAQLVGESLLVSVRPEIKLTYTWAAAPMPAQSAK